MTTDTAEPERCVLVHESTPCGTPAVTTGPTGAHHEVAATGPMCARCATMQELVHRASLNGGSSLTSPTQGVLLGGY